MFTTNSRFRKYDAQDRRKNEMIGGGDGNGGDGHLRPHWSILNPDLSYSRTTARDVINETQQQPGGCGDHVSNNNTNIHVLVHLRKWDDSDGGYHALCCDIILTHKIVACHSSKQVNRRNNNNNANHNNDYPWKYMEGYNKACTFTDGGCMPEKVIGFRTLRELSTSPYVDKAVFSDEWWQYRQDRFSEVVSTSHPSDYWQN